MSTAEKNVLSMVEDGHWSKQRILLIKQTVAKNATEAELAQFIMVAKQLGLDPLAKEIVFDKYVNKKGEVRVSFITTRDGYLKIAMRDPNYRGLVGMPVKEGDDFKVNPTSPEPVAHCYGTKRGKLLGAYAVAKHARRDPVVFWADFQEYFQANSSSNAWTQYPNAMIQKVAEVGALRRQFNIVALPTQEEGMAAEIESNFYSSDSNAKKAYSDAEPAEQTEYKQKSGGQEVPTPASSTESQKSSDNVAAQQSESKADNTQNKPAEDQNKDQQLPIYTVQDARERQANSGKKVLQLALKGEDGKIVQGYAPQGPVFEMIAGMKISKGARVAVLLAKKGKILEINDIHLLSEAGEIDAKNI